MIVFYNIPQRFKVQDFQKLLEGLGFQYVQIIFDPCMAGIRGSIFTQQHGPVMYSWMYQFFSFFLCV